MKDGTVGWNPGKLNPKIERPAGPIDPAVPLIYVETPDGKPIASYVNYALHSDTMSGKLVSADFSSVLAKTLGDGKGPDLVSLFTMVAPATSITSMSAARPFSPGRMKPLGSAVFLPAKC